MNESTIEDTGDYSEQYDVFWTYKVSGLHEGNSPIELAVKNPRYEADGDEHGTYYVIEYDGVYVPHTKEPIDDEVWDTYSDDVLEQVRESLNSI